MISAKPVCVARVMRCLALWMLIGGGPAQAALIATNDPVFGPNSIVLDTSTGLEWLNLTRTRGLSAQQVLAQLGPGGQFASFEYADRDEFVTLFTEVFGTSFLPHPFGGLDLNTTLNFVNLFGPTSFTPGGLPLLNGLFDVTGSGPFVMGTLIMFFYDRDINGELSGGTDTNPGGGGADRMTGSFLVRALLVPIPEPSLSLLTVSLMMTAAVLLRRNRKPSSTARPESCALCGLTDASELRTRTPQ